MDKPKVYLDHCCFNRPFDCQAALKIRIETECKLWIQQAIKGGQLVLCWSYILDYENAHNPFLERKRQIQQWKQWAVADTAETAAIVHTAKRFVAIRAKPLDALHLACAIQQSCHYFITVDKGILKLSGQISQINVVSPVHFVTQFEDG